MDELPISSFDMSGPPHRDLQVLPGYLSLLTWLLSQINFGIHPSKNIFSIRLITCMVVPYPTWGIAVAMNGEMRYNASKDILF